MNPFNKRLNQISRKTSSILSVFQKAKADLEQNIADFQELENSIETEIRQQEQLQAEVVSQKESAEKALSKFTEWLGE